MTNLPAWKNVISGGLLPNGSPLYYYSPAPSFGGGGSGSVAYADTAGTASYVNIRGLGITVNYGPSFISLTGSGGSGSSSVSSSYAETASFAFYAVSASHEIIQELSSSYADTASQAISSSYASTASFVNILGNKIIVNNYPGGIQLTGSDTVATASYVQLNYGPGIIPDPITPMAFSASVRSVNGIFPTNGNIATTLVGVTTGTSASLSVSSSGDVTASLNEGEVWVISNDPTASNNGRAFIYDEDNVSGIGTWYELSPTDLAVTDARYLKLDGANSPLQGNVNLGGFDLTNGDLIGTSSWAITSSNAISASYAATASQALTASYINVTGSNVIVNWFGEQLQLTGSGDAKVIISGSTPGNKDAGALWFNTMDGNTYIQYSDPNGNVWIPATTNVGQAFSASFANSSLSSSIAITASVAERVTGLAGQLLSSDNRVISPSEISASYSQFGFTAWNNNNVGPFADYIHMRGWGDATGGNDNLVMFRKDAIGVRVYQAPFGTTTPYSSSKDLAFTDATNATGRWPTASLALTASVISNTQATTLIFAQNGSAQAIPWSTSTIVTNWTNISTQNAAEWNNAAGTFTATKVGTYLVSAGITYSSKAANAFGEQVNVQIHKNGVALAVGANYAETGNSIFRGTVNATAYVPVVAGDVITIRTFVNLGVGGFTQLNPQANLNTLTIQEISSRILR
jgi:hypothetical protein